MLLLLHSSRFSYVIILSELDRIRFFKSDRDIVLFSLYYVEKCYNIFNEFKGGDKMKYTVTNRTTYSICPHCGCIAKKSTESSVDMLLAILFFPYLIILIISWFLRRFVLKRTVNHERVIICKHCGESVVICIRGTRKLSENEHYLKIVEEEFSFLEQNGVSLKILEQSSNRMDCLTVDCSHEEIEEPFRVYIYNASDHSGDLKFYTILKLKINGIENKYTSKNLIEGIVDYIKENIIFVDEPHIEKDEIEKNVLNSTIDIDKLSKKEQIDLLTNLYNSNILSEDEYKEKILNIVDK